MDLDRAAWHLEEVPTANIDQMQVFDDADDEFTIAELNQLAAVMSIGRVPPLLLLHAPGMADDRGDFFLWDGMHRFNAGLQIGQEKLDAWVAHEDGCCSLSE